MSRGGPHTLFTENFEIICNFFPPKESELAIYVPYFSFHFWCHCLKFQFLVFFLWVFLSFFLSKAEVLATTQLVARDPIRKDRRFEGSLLCLLRCPRDLRPSLLTDFLVPALFVSPSQLWGVPNKLGFFFLTLLLPQPPTSVHTISSLSALCSWVWCQLRV